MYPTLSTPFATTLPVCAGRIRRGRFSSAILRPERE